MTGRRKPERKSHESSEVKGVALNLTYSSEKPSCWEWAEPLMPGAGHVVRALSTSAKPPPRGLRQHRAGPRQARNQASDEQGLVGKCARHVPEYSDQWNKRAGNGRVASDGDRRAAMASLRSGSPPLSEDPHGESTVQGATSTRCNE